MSGPRPRPFTSWLASHFDRFVALRRASGTGYVSQRHRLLAFDRHLNTHASEPPLRRETMIQYLASLERLAQQGRDTIVGVVWPALTYALSHGAQIEALPARPPRAPSYLRERLPRIVSLTEAKSLVATRELSSQDILRPATTATLIGLLYTTGIRIGEALALNVGDLERHDQIVTVRKGKFGKSRALPLRQSTTEALARYIDHPLRPMGTDASAPVFVSRFRRRLEYSTARLAIRDKCQATEIAEPWPRPHDFRHTFAVSRVEQWYSQGRDVDALLPALSTYLGHVSVEKTRRYLIANGALLEEAAARFAHYTRALDEVLP